MRKPSEIARDLHEARDILDEQLKKVEELGLELASSVSEKSIVYFSYWVGGKFVNLNALIIPGSTSLEYIKEAP